MLSGCTINLMDGVEDGRIYGPVSEYTTQIIPIMSVFDFVVKKEWGIMHYYPICHQLRQLTVDDKIGYFSFTSLN